MSRYILFSLLVVMLPAYAMSDVSQWAKAIPDASLVSVERTLDGGYIAAGSKGYKNGTTGALLVRVDSSGNIQWAKAYQFSDNDSASMVYAAEDGGFVFTGTTNRVNDSDAFLIKVDASGNILWQRTYGTPSVWEEGRVILRTSDGGFFLLGNRSSAKGGSGIWCMKLNSKKEIAWVKNYGQRGIIVSSAAGTKDGGLILLGVGGVPLGGSIVVKLDASGNITWQKGVTGHGGSGGPITTTADGGYVVGNNSFFWGARGGIAKLDSSGNLSWSRFFPGMVGGVVQAVRQENDGHILVMGWTGARTQIWSTRFDLQGALVSRQAFGGTQTRVEYGVSAIHDTPEDGTVFVGSRSLDSGTGSLIGRTSWAGDICTAFQKSGNIKISQLAPTVRTAHIAIKEGAFEVRKPSFVQSSVNTTVKDLCW